MKKKLLELNDSKASWHARMRKTVGRGDFELAAFCMLSADFRSKRRLDRVQRMVEKEVDLGCAIYIPFNYVFEISLWHV